jgi:hypothetical protein
MCQCEQMEVPDASGDGVDRQMDGVPDGWTDEWLGAVMGYERDAARRHREWTDCTYILNKLSVHSRRRVVDPRSVLT